MTSLSVIHPHPQPQAILIPILSLSPSGAPYVLYICAYERAAVGQGTDSLGRLKYFSNCPCDFRTVLIKIVNILTRSRNFVLR